MIGSGTAQASATARLRGWRRYGATAFAGIHERRLVEPEQRQ